MCARVENRDPNAGWVGQGERRDGGGGKNEVGDCRRGSVGLG